MASTLPAKPTTAVASPCKRGASPTVTPNKGRNDRDSASTSQDSSSSKGRYERKAPADGSSALLSRALGNLREANQLEAAAAASAPSTPSSSKSISNNQNNNANVSASRAQFEQQEDFISFEAELPKPTASRATPQRSGGNGKRKNDHEWDEEGRDEGSRKVRKRERDRSTPWCDEPGVDWDSCTSATSMLNAEASSFIKYISPTPVEHQLRMWIVELIRRTIQSRWSDADVQCFGSVGTGLYLPGGDIDLVVLCPSFPSPPSKPSSGLLHSLASLLLTSSIAEPSSLLVIAKARVPIVKFVTRYGGFSVDLSVNQQNGVDAAVRVRALLETYAFREEGWVEPGALKGKEKEDERSEDPVVDHGVARSLVMLVKAFLNQRGMNEVFTGGLGSYSIICLVVSFLQLHPKIQSGEIHPAKNIGLLFQEFNEYYGKHFNYDDAGITLRGKGGYFNKHDKGWWRAQQPYLLSIEDPNDPLNDVSGGSHNIIRVRQTLAGAADCLSATLFQRASEFAARYDPSIVPLSSVALPNADYDAPNPFCQSVLGSIIGMSREGIQSRKENVRLHREGVLQSLLEKSDSGKTTVAQTKKAQKKLRQQEKDQKRQQKTLSRLEMRQEEREKKAEKKAAKKAREAGLDPEVIVAAPAPKKSPSVADDEIFFVDTVARKLFTEIGGVGDNEAMLGEDSRYSIATGSNQRSPAKAVEVLYIDSDDSEDDDDDEGDDQDVVMGGTGGLMASSAGGRRGREIFSAEQSSDEEVKLALVRKSSPTKSGKKE